MSKATIPHANTTLKLDLVDDLIDEFERRWNTGKPPQIGSFLSLPSFRKVSSCDRLDFLVELILVDLEYRWRGKLGARYGTGISFGKLDSQELPHSFAKVEDYVAAYPEISSKDYLLGRLLEEEFRVRQRQGDDPSVEEFVARFPRLEARLRHKLPMLATCQGGNNESTLLPIQQASSLRDFRIPLITNQYPKPRESVVAPAAEQTPSVWSLRDAPVNFLSELKPFANFSTGLIKDLAERMSGRDFLPGEWLVREVDCGKDLFAIMSGEASEIASDGNGGKRVIDRKTRGDIVGDFALVTGHPHLASVRATTPMKTLCLTAAQYADFARQTPIVAVRLAELFSKAASQKSVDAFCGKMVQGYRIRRRIARGTMSVIYEAESPSGETVALKMLKHHLALDDEAKKRFLREADILRALKHPNIVRYYETIDAFGTSCHVLEHCGSATLAETIAKQAPIAEKQVRHVIGQLASALSYAHSMGIVHRDLKPSNILLRDDGSVLLIDFGLSHSSRSMALTQWGEILGTPGYMPPEQLVGTPVNESADLYALGCVTFEMLTGRPLFQTNDEMDLLHEKLRLPPQVKRLSGRVTRGMSSFLCGSLAANSEDRVLKLDSIASW